MLPGPHHRGLTAMQIKMTGSLNWELRREQMSYGTPGKAYTNFIPSWTTCLSILYQEGGPLVALVLSFWLSAKDPGYLI